jgi:hypothetical protein
MTTGFDTGAYRGQCKPLTCKGLRRFATPIMRERYPCYARRRTFNTQLMRESVPRLCVQICRLPEEIRNDPKSHFIWMLSSAPAWSIPASSDTRQFIGRSKHFILIQVVHW